jgi:5-methylcytosine-specific restriction endonuclease McrA
LSGEPDPKSRSLARGERRYRRKVASPKQWEAIIAAKTGPCRVCVTPGSNGHGWGVIEFHHVVPRSWGGDDLADNIVPLHAFCHVRVSAYEPTATEALAASLTDSEYSYVVGKLGESGPARLFGVNRGGI